MALSCLRFSSTNKEKTFVGKIMRLPNAFPCLDSKNRKDKNNSIGITKRIERDVVSCLYEIASNKIWKLLNFIKTYDILDSAQRP